MNKLPHPVVEGFSNILKSHQSQTTQPELDPRKLPGNLRPNEINFSSVLNHGISMNEEKSDMSPVKETPGQGLKASEMNNQSKGMLNGSSNSFSHAQNLIASNFVLDEVISEKDEESKQEYAVNLHSVMEESQPEASLQSGGNPTHIVQDYDIPNEPSEVQYRHETSQDEIPEPQEGAEERLRAEQAERERREREAIEHAEKRALDIKKAEIDALRELQGEIGEIEGKANDILSRYSSKINI